MVTGKMSPSWNSFDFNSQGIFERIFITKISLQENFKNALKVSS